MQKMKSGMTEGVCSLFAIPEWGHTLARIAQCQLNRDPRVFLAGYRKSDPLKDGIELEIRTRAPRFAPITALRASLKIAEGRLLELDRSIEFQANALGEPQTGANEPLYLCLRGVSMEIANGLVRSMRTEVPTLAIDLVNFDSKSTLGTKGIITHRLGMVPLRSEHVEELRYAGECECDDWCQLCSVTFTIESKGAGVVTTKDLRTSDRNFAPLLPHARIVSMGEGESLKLTAIARKGTGKTNAKWDPVSTVMLQIVPDIELNRGILEKMTSEEKSEWAASCPKGIFKCRNGGIGIEDCYERECDYCMACVDKSTGMNRHGLVAVRERENTDGTRDFLLRVESSGVLKPATIVRSALRALLKKIRNFRAPEPDNRLK